VFIGGGTPSLFSPQSFTGLFSGLQERLSLTPQTEITLEANPSSSEIAKFEGFRDAGINRLSIGIQSFNESHLRALGRIHNPQDAINAANYARQAGFDNFNLDLMFGLPQQSTEQALSDLAQALALSPPHLSCYQLTIEPNTLFHHNPPITPDDDSLWETQSALQSMLTDHSFSQYEVSAYCKKSKRCQHNLNYWQFGDYLGIGAGAHGKITSQNTIFRTWKIKHPASYMEKVDKRGGLSEVVGPQIPFEFMMNALRLNEGFSISHFEQRCGISIEEIAPLLDKHQSLKLIKRDQETIAPTKFGHNMLNSMLEDYLELNPNN